ncbi:MAG TPA: AAA family ATPase, partial [Kofleriaceae bacterium]|nr:AAA family ATPase [Kofleriaceae bacterium]
MGASLEIFVGRSEEVALLDSLLDEARAGAGRLVILTGEPGIGKSRLAEEVTRRAQAAGCLTAWGRSWEGPGTPAYWPWVQLLRRIGDAYSDELLAPAAATEDAEHARFLLFDRVARALHAVAAQRPLLLVLDDIHAADAASLMLLQFVARGLRGSRVLLIAAARDASFVAPSQTYPLLAQVAREARHIALERLARSDLSDWVARAAAVVEVDRLYAVTEGNPLYVEELLAAAKKRPDVRLGAGQLPLGIREAMRAHLALVSEPALRLLEIASVVGRELPRSLLEAVAAPHELEALDEALASDILRDVGEGRLRFSHMLVRDELYARLGEDRRGALHQRAASASQDRAAAAHHALLGARAEDAASALARVHAAMRETSGRLAHEDAARLGQRALETLERHLAPAEICALLVAIGEARVLAGDLAGGQVIGERAAAMAAELGLPELLARGALTRAAEVAFGGDDTAAEWLRRALEALPDGDSPVRVQLMARLAVAIHVPAA